jgi:hypothetical protein
MTLNGRVVQDGFLLEALLRRLSLRFSMSMLSLAILLVFTAGPGARAFDPKAYILDFGQPPADWTQALDETRLSTHRNVTLTFLACSQEVPFLQSLDPKTGFHHVNDKGDENAGEDLFDYLLAKLVWLKRNNGDCTGDLGDADAGVLQQGEDTQFAGSCSGLVHDKTVTIPRACLTAQINVVLASAQQGDLQLGTSTLPCYIVGAATRGEWDASLRVLVRIFYLDRDRAGAIIAHDARTNLHDNLLSVDGSPAEESYSLLECGNKERSTGSAEDRADEHSWEDDALNDVGDFFGWLLKRLLLLIAAAAILIGVGAIAIGVLGTLLAGVVAAATVAGLIVVAFLRVPETENHLMQINSAKFLINQVMLDEVAAEDAHHLPSDQSSVRDWLLNKMQQMLQQDFIEYNAIPYQRYTLGAIMNLADFSEDAAVRDGARLVLEYYLAKYAIGSSELRRYSPFRRRAEMLQCYDQDASCDGSNPARTVFDLGGGANHTVGIMQFYAGPSRALPAKDQDRLVTTSSTGEMLFAATSDYRPQPLTMALTLDKSKTFVERIRLRDGGAEIISSGPAATITGGGVITDHANSPYFVGISLPSAVANISPDGESDKGAAWPIVIMSPGPTADNMYLHRFIRINGVRTHVVGQGSAYSYDHNLCIWQGFACGRDLAIPPELSACMAPDGAGWFFLDSADPRCTGSAYAGGQRFYAAGMVSSIDGALDGFIEVIDARDATSFGDFMNRVRARNPTINAIRGVYNSFSGHAIYFDTRGHQLDSDRTGIEMVDGVRVHDLDDWPHADGPISGSWSNAAVTITNPGLANIASAPVLPGQVRLDFSDRHNPHMDLSP